MKTKDEKWMEARRRFLPINIDTHSNVCCSTLQYPVNMTVFNLGLENVDEVIMRLLIKYI